MNEPIIALCLGSIGLAGLAAVGAVGFRVALALWVQAEQTRLQLAAQRLDVEDRRLALDRARLQVTQQVHADENGVYPLLWDGSQALDPNRGIVFDIREGVQVLAPVVAQPEQLARILRAAGGWPGGQAAQNLLDRPPVTNWPGKVALADLLTGRPSVHSLVLGVTTNGQGPETVRGDMEDLVHIAVGGSSGWGKSVFLRGLTFQLALSRDPVDLALVDLEGVTFAPFSRCERLLWPVADTERDALAIFQALIAELSRRKELFAAYPGVDKLSLYNATAAESLAPIVTLIDEATALLDDKSVESALRTLTLRARKYGLWVVMGGQDWKASSLDTAIRNMLSTRVQFKAMSGSQSKVLLDTTGAEKLEAKGRALARLPGRDLVEIQAPYIDRRDILAAVTGSGPRNQVLPGPAETDPGEDDQTARILELAAQGLSQRQICLAMFGYDGGAAYNVVSAALAGSTTTTNRTSGITGRLIVIK